MGVQGSGLGVGFGGLELQALGLILGVQGSAWGFSRGPPRAQ